MQQIFSSGHDGWPHALYCCIRLPGVRSGVGCSDCQGGRRELFPRQGRPGSGLSAQIMRVCGPGIIADSCTHHRYLIRRNPAQGHHPVMSRAAPGVPSCDVRTPGPDQIPARTGNCLASLSALLCLES